MSGFGFQRSMISWAHALGLGQLQIFSPIPVSPLQTPRHMGRAHPNAQLFSWVAICKGNRILAMVPLVSALVIAIVPPI